MVQARIDIQREVKKIVDDNFKRIVRNSRDPAKALMKREVLNSIARGVSPAKGGGDQTGGSARFVRYSESYINAILKGRFARFSKRLRPVNLKLSGKMLRSIKTLNTKTGFTIFFSDRLADIHQNQGAGRRKVKRKLLPDARKGETFSRVITNKLVKLIQSFI